MNLNCAILHADPEIAGRLEEYIGKVPFLSLHGKYGNPLEALKDYYETKVEVYFVGIYPVEADLVVGVPDSGLVAAKGYSEQSGIPYGMAFHKNSYVGRTFIKPKQSDRESSVKIKLNVIPEVVKGKRIVMVDDSIVRGTTCANIIKMLKKAGATEVHVRISSPPFLHPCYFGTDVPSNEQLIAHSHTPEQIRDMIGADSLGYMEIEKLKNMVGDLHFCDACFTGNYPMEVPGEDISQAFE